ALPALALENPARLATAGIVARSWHCLAECNALAVLAILRERPMREPLLVAQLHAREIEHTVLHGAQHLLAAAGAGTLIERRHDAEGEMQPGAGIADLRAGDERRPLAEARGRGGAAGALRDVLIDLAVLVRAGA